MSEGTNFQATQMIKLNTNDTAKEMIGPTGAGGELM